MLCSMLNGIDLVTSDIAMGLVIVAQKHFKLTGPHFPLPVANNIATTLTTYCAHGDCEYSIWRDRY